MCFLFPLGMEAQSGTSIALGGSCFSPNPLVLPYHSMQSSKPAYLLNGASVDGNSVTVVVLWDPVTLGGIWAIQFSGQTHYYNTSNTANPNSTNIDTWQNAMQSGSPSCLNSATITGDGTIGGVLSVASNELTNSIEIYPNPTQGIFTLNHSGIEKVEVYNYIGQKVLENNQKTINISHLTNGIYVLKVYINNGKVGMKRFVKE